MKNTVSLNRNYDFLRLYKKGRSFVAGMVVLYVLPNRRGQKRLGITASKKIGGAVIRVRARRVLKEAYRSLEDCIPNGQDIVLVSRMRTPECKSHEVAAQLRRLLDEAGVLKKAI